MVKYELRRFRKLHMSTFADSQFPHKVLMRINHSIEREAMVSRFRDFKIREQESGQWWGWEVFESLWWRTRIARLKEMSHLVKEDDPSVWNYLRFIDPLVGAHQNSFVMRCDLFWEFQPCAIIYDVESYLNMWRRLEKCAERAGVKKQMFRGSTATLTNSEKPEPLMMCWPK